LRIVSLNTWKNEGDYPRRLGLMSDGLSDLDADVICLQECFAGGGSDTAGSLASALGLCAHPAPARRKLRHHGPDRVMSTSGLAILTRDPAARIDLCALVSDPRDGQRIAQRIDLACDGRPLRVLNLHLTHLGDARARAIRAAQLKAALAWAMAGYHGGLVLAGDLNATAEDDALASLGLKPTPATFHGARIGEATSQALAIDHCVLLREGAWRTVANRHALDRPDRDGWFPSDHAAVVLDLAAEGAPTY
jgi:endonuclease/exonuclease/phosphatase family metal-dependent hydrolase